MKKINRFAIGVGLLATVAVPSIAVTTTKSNKKINPIQFSFINDLNKIQTKLKSTKNNGQLKSALETKKQKGVVTSEELGIIAPTLSIGVDVVYIVKTPYDVRTGIIVVTAILSKNNKITKKDITITRKEIKLSKEEVQAINLKFLKAKLTGGVVTQAKDKASVIARRINDVTSLKFETGIDLATLDVASTHAISASGTSEGVITISVLMTTKGANTPASDAVTSVINHESDVDLLNKIKAAEVQAAKDQVQTDNLQALRDKLKDGVVTKVIDKASVIARRIISVATLLTETAIDLSTLGGASTYVISASGTPEGMISISVTMTTPGSTTPLSTAVTSIINHKSDVLIDKETEARIVLTTASKVQAKNLETLKTKLTGGVVTKVIDKASVIARRIISVATLLTETAIDLTSLATTSTYVISASGTPEGVIAISVVMTTPDATTPLSTAVISIINHKSDVLIDNKMQTKVILTTADKVQAKNLETLKTKLTGGTVTKVIDKASIIAGRIKDAATLKTDAGIDLTSLAISSTYIISAKGTTDGKITVFVVMTTPDATIPSSTAVISIINHKSDAIVDSEIQTKLDLATANKVQSKNLETLKTKLNGGVVIKVIDKAAVIAARIISAATLKTETGIDLTTLAISSTYVISASGTPEGVITVSVLMTTTGASTPTSAVLTSVIKHTSDFTLASDAQTAKVLMRRDKVQAANWQALNVKITEGIVTQTNDRASVIAGRITSAATLKTETGIDLTTLADTSTYAISATSDSDGISVIVVMTTTGATTPISKTIIHHINYQKTTAQENIKAIFALPGLSNLSIFKDPILRNQIADIFARFIKNGLNGITFEDFDNLLTIFDVDKKTKKMIYPLFTKKDAKDAEHKIINIKLINMFLNTGLSSLGNKENIGELRSIGTIVTSFLPPSITLNDALIKKLLLTGFANKNEFFDDVFAVISKIHEIELALDNWFVGGTVKGIIKNILLSIYEEFSGMLKHGILNISTDDLKQIINWDGLLSVPGLESDISLAKSFSSYLPEGIEEMIDKIKITSGELDVLHTANNFLKIDEIVPEGWTTFDRIIKIWNFLKELNKSNSVDTLLGAIPTILQKGVNSLMSKEINQLANMVDFIIGYDVKITKTSSDNLKKAIIKLFDHKFADAQNTNPVDLSILNNVKNIKNFANIAKNIIVFNPKQIRKIIIARPHFRGHYINPLKTLDNYKKRLINKLKKLYSSKTKHQKLISVDYIEAVKNAKTIQIAKQIVDSLNSNGLYTKYYVSWWSSLDKYGKSASVDTTIPPFADTTPTELASYKNILKPLIKELFIDKKLKKPVLVDTIDQAKTLEDVIKAFDKLAKSLYTDVGTKFVPDIKSAIENNPVVVFEYKQSTIDQFKKDALDALNNIFIDKAHSISLDTATINDASTIKEIQTAFSILVSGTLYDVSGKALTTKPIIIIPPKDLLPKPLTTEFLTKPADGTYGRMINAIYHDWPQLNDFLFHGISNIQNDQTKLDEFVPKTLMPLLKALMPILKIDALSINDLEPLIAFILNPIINKIAMT